MKRYGSLTPKRHLGYSNSSVVSKLYSGYLSRKGQALLKNKKPKVSTVKHHVDKRGRKRFSGTAYLKQSQQEPQGIFYQQPG